MTGRIASKPFFSFNYMKIIILLSMFFSWNSAFAVYGFKEAAIDSFNKIKVAAENGDKQARLKLSEYYFNGSQNVVPQDINEGMRQLLKLAEDGYDPAQYELAKKYSDGVKDNNFKEIIKRDIGSAEIWALKSAEQGNIQALSLMVSIEGWKSQNKKDPAVIGAQYVWSSLASNNGDRNSTMSAKIYGDQISPESKLRLQSEIDKFQEKINENKRAISEQASVIQAASNSPALKTNDDPLSMTLKDFEGSWKVSKLLSNSGSKFNVLSQASSERYMVYEFSGNQLKKYDVNGSKKVMIGIEAGITVSNGIMTTPVNAFSSDKKKISIENGTVILKGTFDTVFLQRL